MSFNMDGLIVYLDGRYLRAEDARVSVFDHGLLYGDGIFEGLRVFSGALFRPHDHLGRLERSARALMLELPQGPTDLLDVLCEVARRSGLVDAHMRIVVSRGFGTPGLDPWRCERPTLVVMGYPFPPLLGERPLRLITTSIVRKAPRSLGAHVKSLNYLDSIVAKQQARAAAMDDAVMLDSLGAVAECTSTNIFLVRDGILRTPTTRAALPGITRMTVLEAAAELGIDTREEDIWPMDLYAADAVFVTGSGAGVVAVGEVDGRPLESADNNLLQALAAAYRDRTHDKRLTVPINHGQSS